MKGTTFSHSLSCHTILGLAHPSVSLTCRAQLSNRGFVQWVSPSERPDLGGREEDDNTIISELQSSAAFCINNEGMYHSICVELKIESLAINAVLRAADLSLAE
ncbi:hypothetical protein SARC_15348, partial [Sphaeroforma arctica JP610]